MRTFGQFLVALLCAASAALGSGQEPVPSSAATPANAAKSMVRGKVVQEPGGQGIRKARVNLRGVSAQGLAEYAGVTDEAGQFKIENVPPATYTVQVERSGYTPDPKTSPVTSLKVIAGQDTTDLVFRLLLASVISGKIVDSDGDPLANVGVSAVPVNGAVPRRNLARHGGGSTNDLGEYRIADLPPGKYIVSAFPSKNLAPSPNPSNKEAAKEQLIYLTTYFPGTSDKRQAFVVEVSTGSNVTANFALQSGRAYRVSGTVTGLPPEPAPQSRSSSSPETDFADVVMASAGGGRGQLILVGADGQREEQNLRPDGSFEFPSVLAGTYRAQIIVMSGFFNGQRPSLKVQSIRTPVEVNGADVIGLNLQLDPTGTVSGRFRADGNEKIDWRQLSVGLQNLPSTEGLEMGMFVPSQHSLVGEDGSFEIKDVPAGNYQFVVGAHSNKFRDYFTKSVLLGGQEVADTGFAVNSATVLDVLVSAKGANIEGTVLNSEGKPAPGATVVTVPNSGKLGRPDSYQSDRTDERGHFVLRGLNPGAFTVLAFEEMTEDYRAPEFAKKYQSKGENVDLEESARKSVALKLIPAASDAQ